jgi:hypothetical protein
MDVSNPDLELTRYRDWAPTTFDRRGLALCREEDDRGDWYVVPLILTRDSDCLSESNFAAAVRLLGGESETVEVHEFGHWACGWFRIIIAAPERIADVFAIAKRLDNYPVLDEEDVTYREFECAGEVWRDRFDVAERLSWIRDNGHSFRTFGELLGCVRGDYFPVPPNGDYQSLVGP